MSTFIRRCTVADAEALAAIYDPIVANTYVSFEQLPPGPDEMRRRIVSARDDYPWLVFANAGHVRGYAYASPHRSRAAYQWAVDVSVYIAPEAHRQGIARQLYMQLFQTLAAQGYCAAFAGVALPNEPSCRLHVSVGFSTVGVYHAVGFKFNAWHDVMWFERRLRPATIAPSAPLSLAELERVYRTGDPTREQTSDPSTSPSS